MTDSSSRKLTLAVAEPGPVLDACYAIRRKVFVDEQNVDANIEFDGLDEDAVHYVAFSDGAVAACGRMVRLSDETVKIGRVAVIAGQRRTGIGKALMAYILADVTRRGYSQAVLHAQSAAAQFYEALGFSRVGGEFTEANIPHFRMQKSLP